MYVLYAIRCTLQAILYAIRDSQYEIRTTNSYVRNYKQNMQNKPNFRKSQMNVSYYITREYEKMDTWPCGKNKANSKPIQTQYKPNSKPKQSQFEPKQSQFHYPKRRRKAVLLNGLYKPVNERYHSRCQCRCSSTVEHSFRKAGVVGSNPSIGCFSLADYFVGVL